MCLHVSKICRKSNPTTTYDFFTKVTIYKPIYFRYKAYDEDHSMLERVRKHFLTDLDHYRLYLASLPPDAYVESCRWKTWIVLEYPYSSLVAKVCVLWVVSVSY